MIGMVSRTFLGEVIRDHWVEKRGEGVTSLIDTYLLPSRWLAMFLRDKAYTNCPQDCATSSCNHLMLL